MPNEFNSVTVTDTETDIVELSKQKFRSLTGYVKCTSATMTVKFYVKPERIDEWFQLGDSVELDPGDKKAYQFEVNARSFKITGVCGAGASTGAEGELDWESDFIKTPKS